MSEYFKGSERLEIFEKTGGLMRMGLPSQLEIPDYQVLRNLVRENKWDESLQYLTAFHAQNVFMNSVFIEWCMILTSLYAEMTSVESEQKFRVKAISDYKKLIDGIGKLYTDKSDLFVVEQMKNIFDGNFSMATADFIVAEMEKDFKDLSNAFNEKDLTKSLNLITTFHHRSVIRHDSLDTFVYSYPTSIIDVDGEKVAIEVSNGSILRNQKWLGLWELSKSLSPMELAAFLAEHLRFHFSGDNREGKTTVVEDDKKIRLIFDPCGSGGAIRRRLGDDVVNLQEKHDLAWNKCGEVNLYCSHCALNEKYSIDLFGYPKLVVEFQADKDKPCGWTIYKNKEDVPQEVYQRLGLKS